MALPPLASVSDLSDRGVDVDDVPADIMLDVASSLVRGAAASPIASHEATVVTWATDGGEYLHLDERLRPVTGVTSVMIDGATVTDYLLVDGDLWRASGWFSGKPTPVSVTAQVGLPEVPEHIKQLVCDLAILGIQTAADGAIDPRAVTESIDDYTVTFARGAEVVASAMTIPRATRVALRSQFGGGVSSVGFK